MYQRITCRQSNFSSLTSLMYWIISNVMRPSGNNRRVHSLWLKKTIKVRNFYATLMVRLMCRNNHSHAIYTTKQCNRRSTKAIIGLEGSFDNFTDFFLCRFHPFSRGIWCDTEIQEWLFHWHVTAIKQNWWLGKRIQRIMILKDINKKQ